MSAQSNRLKISHLLDVYRERLDLYPDEVFDLVPQEGTWSYAEVYSHILNATYQSLLAAERCVNNLGKVSTGTPLLSRLILVFGTLPPGRYKSPPQLQKFNVKISKEDARNLIIRIRKKLATLTPDIQKCNNGSYVAHPVLGMFNAKQWLRFTYIHLKHHLKQLGRISKMLAKKHV